MGTRERTILAAAMTAFAVAACAAAQAPTISRPAEAAALVDAAPTTRPADGIYRNKSLLFEFTVPEGWFVSEAQFEAFHYDMVFLTVNSKRSDLRLTAQFTSETRLEFNSKTRAQQMLPGEVYISFSLAGGPGPLSMSPDSVNEDLGALLSTHPMAASSADGISGLGFSFAKRGRFWSISAYLRDPVAESDRKKVLSMLGSFRFVDGPVRSIVWAESLAWKVLPEPIRNPPQRGSGWPVAYNLGGRPSSGGRSVVVQKSDAGYFVTFTQANVGDWTFLVSEDGTVKQVGQTVLSR
jgi:hypothetical protein